MANFIDFDSGDFSASDKCCPLCTGSAASYGRDNRRHYFICSVCNLVFVPPSEYLSLNAEKAEYDRHDNQLDDPHYRKFLGRLFDPMCERLAPPSLGLEFGCGPGPALAKMFQEQGFEVSLYDTFYFPDKSVLEQTFDFITATEVVEHLHQPFNELSALWSCLGSGGTLGLMTKLVKNRDAFANWHYKNDQTHVCFFSSNTFSWLGEKLSAKVTFIGADVVLLTKQ